MRLAQSYHPSLRYIAPVHVGGPTHCNLLAVWAQNASAGGIRKHQLGPLRRGLSRYRSFLGERPAVIAGDLNSNTIWDKPGWRINHSTKVRILEENFGLVSAYHTIRGEAHGQESEPTLDWRDRTKDGRPITSIMSSCRRLDRQSEPSQRRRLRDLVRRGAERPCAGGRRCRCLVGGRA